MFILCELLDYSEIIRIFATENHLIVWLCREPLGCLEVLSVRFVRGSLISPYFTTYFLPFLTYTPFRGTLLRRRPWRS